MVKNPSVNVRDARGVGQIARLGRSSGVGNGNPLQYSCLENSMDRGSWWTTVHGGHKELDTAKLACTALEGAAHTQGLNELIVEDKTFGFSDPHIRRDGQ